MTDERREAIARIINAATVSCSGKTITIECDNHDVKDALMDWLVDTVYSAPDAILTLPCADEAAIRADEREKQTESDAKAGQTCHDCGYRDACDENCPNCHDAHEYGDYEGPTCEVCGGSGRLSPRLAIAKQLAKSDREPMPTWDEIQPRIQRQFLRSADDVINVLQDGVGK